MRDSKRKNRWGKKVSAPFRVVYQAVKRKSRAGIEYISYKPVVLSNKGIKL